MSTDLGIVAGIAFIWVFQFYAAFSATLPLDYTLLLFWNVFWTLLPVIAIGIFDKNIGEHALMAVPELYENSRRGKYFTMKRFIAYMIDGTYQGLVAFFFITYAYNTTTPRRDGYDVTMYEFSTVMTFATVIAANLYHGLNIRVWNWWVLFSVLLGIVLILCYTAVYAAFKPGLLVTDLYGYNNFLWPAAYFWLGLLFAVVLSLLPRYLYRYVSENYYPSNVDVLRWTDKKDKQQ